MNRQALLCRSILENPQITQRELANIINISLGTTNSLVKECVKDGLIYFNPDSSIYVLSDKGTEFLNNYKVDGAIILAAGFGSRFVPLTFETPKGLLEVFGERMIERQIKQLREAGIQDITIVVGYLKEKFEYLIDKYQIKLLYNHEYANKNTLSTLYHARRLLSGKNMYVLSSDNWMRENMFHAFEPGAWYSSIYQKGATSEWCLLYNKKGRITQVEIGGRDSWVMYGSVYMSKEFSAKFLPVLSEYYSLPGTEQFYWEQVLLEMLNGDAEHRMKESGISCPDMDIDMYVNRQPDDQVYEFENLEELRQFDPYYQNHSDNMAMKLVSKIFQVKPADIKDLQCLKAGMTNKSFLFQIKGKQYICRIPGTGTELLINRRQEKSVYEAIKDLGISEHVVYFSAESGYKIAHYYEGARNPDPGSRREMANCMNVLRKLHHAALRVNHIFNMEERIDFYEKLCKSYGDLLFEDYDTVRRQMNELLWRLSRLNLPKTLCHIDSNYDNFLFLPDGQIKLIDWEYSGMCEPLIDISMSAIYAYYDEEQSDWLVREYLEREPSEAEWFVFYSYMALGGFLWALWAIYKHSLGEEFGEYTIAMYRYAKKYYQKVLTKFPHILRKS